MISTVGAGRLRTLPVRGRRLQTSLLSVLLVVTSLAAASPATNGVTRQLQRLALHAKTPRGWRALRRYARSTRSGQAFFVLGYREFEAGALEDARNDFHLAAETQCSLADLAVYYEALTEQRLNRPASGIETLQDFSERFPESPFRLRAITLLADLLVANQQAKQAIQLLSGEAEPQANPQLLLGLAKAYEAAGNTPEAAKLYQRIYYFFPASPMARPAGFALDRLRLAMGPSYPEVCDKIKTERGDILFQSWRFAQAFRDFDDLLRNEPQSPLAGRWRLARARCLIHLGHYDAAAESLLSPMTAQPTLEPERLALLAHIYERADDQPSLLNTLDELYREAPHSESYAEALFFAGDHFSRHGFWQTALGYYQPLAANFPGSRWANQARWWIAWYTVLAGKDTDATAALEDYLRLYPDSTHVPAALYWLGRLAEVQGSWPQAGAWYRIIGRRFPNSYYGLKARHGLARGFMTPHGKAAELRDNAALHVSPVAMLAALNISLPAVHDPSPDLSESEKIERLLAPVRTLGDLGMKDLANQVVSGILQAEPHNPRLFFALARLRSLEGSTALALLAARRAVPNYQDHSFQELPREAWELLYPHSYWREVRINARMAGLSPYLVMGVIRQESAFNPRATSDVDARGLMQVMPGTAAAHIRSRWRRRRVARLLYSPRYNLRFGSRYLGELLRMFNGNLGEAVAAYNAGDFRVKEWLANGKFVNSDEFVESIPFVDTREYVEEVLRDAVLYHELLTGSARFAPSEMGN